MGLEPVILYIALPYLGGMFLWYTAMVVLHGEPNNYVNSGWNNNYDRFWMTLFWFIVAPLLIGRHVAKSCGTGLNRLGKSLHKKLHDHGHKDCIEPVNTIRTAPEAGGWRGRDL